MKMKEKIKLGEHDLKDTKMAGETEGGPADMVRHMIRKIGVSKGPKSPKVQIGIGKPLKLKDLESTSW